MGKHKNTAQDAVLLEYMESHPDFARGFIKGDRMTMEACWSELTAELNGMGPPVKDVMAWKKVWNDWKAVIRKKLAANKAEATTAGGGAFNQQSLTPTENSIAQIAGIYRVVSGVISFGSTPEPAATESLQDVESCESQEEQAPTTKRNRAEEGSSMQTFRSTEINSLKLIATKVENIANAVDEMVSVLKERNVEIRRHNLLVEQHNAELLKCKIHQNEIALKTLELQRLQLEIVKKKQTNQLP